MIYIRQYCIHRLYLLKTLSMKNLLLTLLILLTNISVSQTLYRYDNVETFSSDWSGIWWTPITTTNYYTNASVSPTTSAVLFGSGNGTSAYESDWYSFPNLVVNPNNNYYLTFRLASYRFTSTNSTRGVDAGDYITVQLSTDGGNNYVNELRITGNNNSFWNYNTNGSYTKTANGTLTVIGPSGTGDRTSTGDGYSVIRLNIPPNTSNIAIDIFARANGAGEEWWMDNFELHEIVNVSLPVELLYFEGKPVSNTNFLYWSTASEHNSDYFEIFNSTNGEDWESIGKVTSSGNSTVKNNYNFYHSSPSRTINYYILKQVDYNGVFKTYNPILIDNRIGGKKIIKYTNLLGQEVGPDEKGVIFITYEDNSVVKTIR
jgi:hypothetical protein